MADANVVLETKVKAFLKKNGYKATIVDLANYADCSPKAVEAALSSLKSKSLNFSVRPSGNVEWREAPVPGGHQIFHNMKNYAGGWMKIGACGDQHLGSNYERLDVNESLYDIYAREGVTQVFNTGNWIEGEAGRMNFADVKVFGLDDQIAYAVKHYPKRKGITTYFVAGDDHEGWYQKKNRIVIGAHFERMAREAGRTDLVYLGYMEADIELPAKFGKSFLKVMHPGGGSAYATSYAPQKIAEAFQEGEKPHICLIGHYHKMDYGYHRGIHMVQTGTGQDQSSFMRKQKIKAHVGGTMLEFHQSPYGEINRFRPEFFTYYDRNFYANRRNFDTSGRVTNCKVTIDKKKAA
jgi:predicted phosphodiesterase